jgi:hypothetical protein
MKMRSITLFFHLLILHKNQHAQRNTRMDVLINSASINLPLDSTTVTDSRIQGFDLLRFKVKGARFKKSQSLTLFLDP